MHIRGKPWDGWIRRVSRECEEHPPVRVWASNGVPIVMMCDNIARATRRKVHGAGLFNWVVLEAVNFRVQSVAELAYVLTVGAEVIW